jgi:hypothetical protein
VCRQIAVLHRMLDVYVEGFGSLMHEVVATAAKKAPLVRALWCYFVAACEQDAHVAFPTQFSTVRTQPQRPCLQTNPQCDPRWYHNNLNATVL